MASSGSATNTAQKVLNPILVRRLYRSMLKTSKPFTSAHATTTTTKTTDLVSDVPVTATKASLRTPVVMNCLLHRTGYDDESWMDFLRGFTTTIRTMKPSEMDDNQNLSSNNNTTKMIELLSQEEREHTLFRILLREVLCGGGSGGTVPPLMDRHGDSTITPPPPPSPQQQSLGQKIMQFPTHLRQNPNRIYHVIHREFRIPLQQHIFDGTTRLNMAFRCLREMNKKLVYAHDCQQKFSKSNKMAMAKPSSTTTTHNPITPPNRPHQQQQHHKIANTATHQQPAHPNPFYYQMAKNVWPLPLVPSSSYLRPGVFLLAHPNMTGYFRRSVICILDHRTGEDENVDDDDEEYDRDTAASMETSDDTSDDEEYDSDDEEYDTDDEENRSIQEGENDTATGAVADDFQRGSSDVEMAASAVAASSQEPMESQPDMAQAIEEEQQSKAKSKTSRKKQKKQQQYGTYGLIVNRLSSSPYTGETLSMNDVLRPLPSTIMKTFGKYPIREGGPVHMSVQMLYQINTSIANSLMSAQSVEEDSEENDATNHHNIGGYILPTIQPDEMISNDNIGVSSDRSSAIGSCDTDKAVYYRGNIMNVIKAMESGIIENGEDDVSFFVGASCWSVGQLEREIENGFWLPCIGPTSIAQTGMCDYYNTSTTTATSAAPSVSTMVATDETQPQVVTQKQQQQQMPRHPRPEADLWLSMMSACGIEEAKLAHLLYKDDGKDKNGAACDANTAG